MKALIIEDESRAARRLQRLLSDLSPETEVIGSLETVRESLEFLQNAPALDLIFSDIQLADGLSFEIFRQITPSCPIIFTTAFDQYAIEAFKTNGVDYLLKPVNEERLLQALAKVKRLQSTPDLQQLMTLLQKPTSPKTYKNRFMVKVGEEIKSVAASEVQAFFSMQKASFLLNAQQRRYVLDYPLDQIESMIDPDRFFRVNRSYILSLEACHKIVAHSNSRLKIIAKGLEQEEIIVSRDRVSAFKAWLDR